MFYRFGLIEIPNKVKEILNEKKKYKKFWGLEVFSTSEVFFALIIST